MAYAIAFHLINIVPINANTGNKCHPSEYAERLPTPRAHAAPLSPTRHDPSALYRSLDELQAIRRRVQADPEVSQRAVFSYYAPLLVFVCFLAPGVGDLKLPALSIRDDFGHKGEAVRALLGLAAVIVGALICLRMEIWAAANAVRIFVKEDFSQTVEGGSELAAIAWSLDQPTRYCGLFGALLRTKECS